MAGTYLLQIEIGLDLGSLKFQGEGFTYLNQILPFVLLGVLLVGAGLLVFFYLRHKFRLEELNRLREEARARLLITEFNLTEEQRDLFYIYAGTENPGAIIPLLESRDAFEAAILAFRQENPKHAALAHVANLRQRMGYGFGNLRIPFDDSKMLPVGSRLQALIPGTKRDIVFLTNIVATGEEMLCIRAPRAKGQPVTLPKVMEMTMKISRENDAEYEFTAKVLGQTPDAMKAVLLQHTRDIQKMLFRNAPRSMVSLDTTFFVVRQQVASEKSHTQFKAGDSQYSFLGNVRDLSIGGALAVVPVSDQNPHVGDWVVFQLPDAQIKDDMVGEVVRLTPIADGHLQVHLRFAGIKEINRLKMNKYLSSLEEPQPEPPPRPQALSS
jgi:c-di-GMP-binding flagellar brake protein YcgR